VKVSYKVLKKYLPNIKSPEEVANDLIMHTAEVEEIHAQGAHLEHVYIGKILDFKKHPDADKLNICNVQVQGEVRQIICGAPNVSKGIVVAVALPGAELKPGFIIQKSKIRGEVSNGMLCSEDELGLVEERQDGIMILPENAPLDIPVKDYFQMDDVILEIDNKAINHRPDLFSHIGIAREIAAIDGADLGYDMVQTDFNHLPDLGIKNDIPVTVKRYMGLKVSGVQNIDSPQYIKDVLGSHDIDSKGILVDITNYSLYLYGQPTHCFDADKLV
jgi:phenylalanyl-tRNA synthetase beta chain